MSTKQVQLVQILLVNWRSRVKQSLNAGKVSGKSPKVMILCELSMTRFCIVLLILCVCRTWTGMNLCNERTSWRKRLWEIKSWDRERGAGRNQVACLREKNKGNNGPRASVLQTVSFLFFFFPALCLVFSSYIQWTFTWCSIKCLLPYFYATSSYKSIRL
jgi:hypothetical protein